jgi:hypothetical protein
MGSDNTASKSHHETGKSNHHGAIPFVKLRPVLRVLGIIDGESHQLPVFQLAGNIGLDRLDDLAFPCLGGVFSKIGAIANFTDR